MSPTPGPTRRRSIRRAVAAAAVAGLALSGCGVGDDTLRPGLAAQVGDTSIELDQVEDAADDLCDMISFLSEQGAASTVPGSLVRDNSLQYAVLRELGEQLAEAHDVEPGDYYRGSIANNEAQLSDLEVDSDLLDEVVPVLSSGDYFVDIVQQIGRQELGLSPEEDASTEGIEEGLRIAREWEAEHGLEVNPRFSDMTIGEIDTLVSASVEDLSVPVSDFAKQALAGVDPNDPDTTYADSLPESQRCG